ncbi:MAG: 1-acyl-sn-glycerol-3-phosphate acyltransferase [Sulfuriflexus sp.]|nr:1-acyl-sn-glycerol-3-phosphate acyltransferase [Sulfuriflexus sp.]
MLFLRSLIFSIGMILATIILATPCFLTILIPYRWRYRYLNLWHRFVIWWLEVTCNVHYEIEGMENIAELNTAAIVFCRHESTWETLALTKFFPPQTWLIKRELLWVPFFGWAIWVLEPIAINRKAGRKALNQVISQGKDRLSKGRWVITFPEGTRLQPTETKPFGIGGAMLASKSGIPVIPVTHNAGEFWPKRGFIKHPGTIKIIVGPAIQTKGRKASEINKEAEEWMNSTRAKLLDKC